MAPTARSIALALTAIVATAVPVAAGTRTVTLERDATEIAVLELESGVGDVTVETHDGEQLSIEVVLIPRRGGFFSSLARAEKAVANARLEAIPHGGRLMVRITTDASGDDRRFEERWTVKAPTRLALDLELGVGDLWISGAAGGVIAELGVGDASLEVTGGDLRLDLGVGDVRVRGPEAGYGRVECSGGVGDSRIAIGGRRVTGDGFVGHSTSWLGDGPGIIEIETGVGDATVTLD